MKSRLFPCHSRALCGLVALAGAVGCGNSSASERLRTMGSVSVDEGPADDLGRAESALDSEASTLRAGAPAPEPEPMPEAPMPEEPMPDDPEWEDWPVSGDGVHCGNGVLDMGELCDIVIPEGEPGACPLACEESDDPCVEVRYEVRTCWSRCVVEPVPDCAG